MASFQYTYQKVVDLKSSEKSQAEWLLSQAIGALNIEEQCLAELLQTKRDWEQKLQEASVRSVALSELQVIGQYLDHLQTCIAAKQRDVRQAQLKVDSTRSKLADRVKDEKIWLKAKDHALERFRHAMRAKEQNELDELATVRFMVQTS